LFKRKSAISLFSTSTTGIVSVLNIDCLKASELMLFSNKISWLCAFIADKIQEKIKIYFFKVQG
jgi:hypothetical protein